MAERQSRGLSLALFLYVALSLYVLSVMVAIPYYNWQFAKNSGFLNWLLLGEIVPTAKGVVWPYYAFLGDGRASLPSVRQSPGSTDAPLPPGVGLSTGADAFKRGDYVFALRVFSALAAQGDVAGQINLGTMYAMGRGVRQDYTEAVKWFRLAAEQGDRLGQYSLADCYDSGEGVRKDPQMAAKWYRLSAEQGWTGSQNNLAVMYARGEGVSQDLVTAYFWFHQAFAGGDAEAGRSRDRLAQKMTATQIQEALSLIRDWKPSKTESR